MRDLHQMQGGTVPVSAMAGSFVIGTAIANRGCRERDFNQRDVKPGELEKRVTAVEKRLRLSK